MNIDEFRRTLLDSSEPHGLSAPLRALWLDGRDDWDAAHKVVQVEQTSDAAWVHAYLHRKEGDLSNADYWYRKAGRSAPDSSLALEWASIATRLLQPCA